MSLLALFAPALIELVDLPGPEMVCAFTEAAGLPVEVRVIDPELERTTSGQFKVDIRLGREEVRGRAAPYDRSPARDVVLRATTRDRSVYLIALRDDGTALLRMKPPGEGAETVTAKGACAQFERHLDRWLDS